MGIIHHHAMIITGHGQHPRLTDARTFAVSLGMLVSEIGESSINGYAHFAVFPDGSKEGWEESASLRQWIASQPEPSRLRWVEVSYGELGPTVTVDEWTSSWRPQLGQIGEGSELRRGVGAVATDLDQPAIHVGDGGGVDVRRGGVMTDEEIAQLRWQVERANDLRDQAYAVAEERTRERDQAIRERDAGARALEAALAKVERPRLNCSIPSCWNVFEHVTAGGRLRSVELNHATSGESIEVNVDRMTIEFRSSNIIESHEIGVVLAALVWSGVKL